MFRYYFYGNLRFVFKFPFFLSVIFMLTDSYIYIFYRIKSTYSEDKSFSDICHFRLISTHQSFWKFIRVFLLHARTLYGFQNNANARIPTQLSSKWKKKKKKKFGIIKIIWFIIEYGKQKNEFDFVKNAWPFKLNRFIYLFSFTFCSNTNQIIQFWFEYLWWKTASLIEKNVSYSTAYNDLFEKKNWKQFKNQQRRCQLSYIHE